MTRPSSPSTASETCAVENDRILNTIHLLIGAKLRVTMTDRRVATGRFVCLDRLSNVVLEDVVELRRVAYVSKRGNQMETQEWETSRSLSRAVVPGDKLAKVEIAREEWEGRVESSDPGAASPRSRDAEAIDTAR